MSRSSSAVWNYIPFTIGASGRGDTPGSSWSGEKEMEKHEKKMEKSEKRDGLGLGLPKATLTAGYGSTVGMGMDRPLPSRTGPAGYSHRPRSVDLVTPFGR